MTTARWQLVQYPSRHDDGTSSGAWYIRTPDGGRWIVDDYELARRAVDALNAAGTK